MWNKVDAFCVEQLVILEDTATLLNQTKELVKQGLLTRDRVELLKENTSTYTDYIEELRLFCGQQKILLSQKVNELKKREKEFREQTDDFISCIKDFNKGEE